MFYLGKKPDPAPRQNAGPTLSQNEGLRPDSPKNISKSTPNALLGKKNLLELGKKPNPAPWQNAGARADSLRNVPKSKPNALLGKKAELLNQKPGIYFWEEPTAVA